MFMVSSIHGYKILEFSNAPEEESGVSLKSNAQLLDKFTLCLDFYSRLDIMRKILSSKDSKDIEIQINLNADRFYIMLKGVWYVAGVTDPGWVDSFKWETVCISYNTEDHAVIVAFRNKILVKKKNPELLASRKFSENFIQSLILGEKDMKFGYNGDITRLNIWSSVFSEEILKNMTNCGSSHYKDTPDVLNWDDVEFTIKGQILEKEVVEYPCTSSSSDINDVLMPFAAESKHDGYDTCKTLGGKLYFPSKEEELDSFVENAKSQVEKSPCDEYVWSNYYKNSYADNNWTVYDADTYWFPPFEYPGWLEFAVGQPNGEDLESCAGIALNEDEESLVHDLDCYSEGYCYMCR